MKDFEKKSALTEENHYVHFFKLKRGAADAVKSAAQNAVNNFTQKLETFTFTALPESLAKLQALPEADLAPPSRRRH